MNEEVEGPRKISNLYLSHYLKISKTMLVNNLDPNKFHERLYSAGFIKAHSLISITPLM